MKFQLHPSEFQSGKTSLQNTVRKSLVRATTVILVAIVTFSLLIHSPIPWPQSPNVQHDGVLKTTALGGSCDVFRGKWVPNPSGTYYTNKTCSLIIDQHNCMKFGRPDTEFMKWRWKPEECELPRFDAVKFLNIARGKSLAFLGDSVGRNQMQSLLCLLAPADHPKETSHEFNLDTRYFKRWYFPQHNFTLATLWAPFLVKAKDTDSDGHTFNNIMNLYLDEPDEIWAAEVSKFDFVVVSAGQWFFRPQIYYENSRLVGCCYCNEPNITDLTNYYGYRKAFRTTFRTILGLEGYRGITFLRTYSPAHFENGAWNEGGSCPRTRPYTNMKMDWYEREMYLTQVEEFRAAQRIARRKGLVFGLIDSTEAMILRPDGHPNHYGQSPYKNTTFNDCVHWCLPGPVDTWNEFLLYLMRTEVRVNKFPSRSVQRAT